MRKCIQCGSNLKPSAKKYCSQQCQKDHQYDSYIKSWKDGDVEKNTGGVHKVSRHIRKYLYQKYDSKCSDCGWTKKNTFTQKIPLEVDHIDGNFKNNKEENLKLICPNCHSLTSTYKGANKGKGRHGRKVNLVDQTDNKCPDCDKKISRHSTRCVQCSNKITNEKQIKKSKKPSKEILGDLIKKKSFTAIGKKYGVSDNAVRRWCRSYNLPYRRKDIKPV